MGEKKCSIKITWDSDSSVWIATSEDVPGLVLESGSFDALLERVRFAVPELLELNDQTPKTIDYCFLTDRTEKVAVNG